MTGSYIGWLVVLSIVVAVVASYVALDLGSRVTASRGRKTAPYWLIGGAVSMGSGIWSMHFIGMLAYRMPVTVSYAVGITLLSLLLPILTSIKGLYTVSRGELRFPRVLASGTAIGLGIVAMHYTGMTAMKMDPPIHYVWFWVLSSIAIAVAGSITGLWIALKLRMETIFTAFWKKAGSAMIVGFAIAGMHYAAMAGAEFAPDCVSRAAAFELDETWLAAAVGTLSLIFLLGTLLISAFDAYVAQQAGNYSTTLEARVRERTAELAHAHRRLVEMQENERHQLSRELHDRVGQNLTALGINLAILKNALADAAGSPEALARLDDSISLVESTTDTIRDVMQALRPPVLDDHGLLAALRWYADEFSKRTGVAVAVQGTEMHPRPTPEQEISLFRIAQEALNNVAKHSRASRVEIELTQNAREIALKVFDNGVGFDTSAPPVFMHAGHGLGYMWERAQTAGGRFELDAAPGAGTRITVRLLC